MNRAYIAEMKKELRGHEEQLMRFRGHEDRFVYALGRIGEPVWKRNDGLVSNMTGWKRHMTRLQATLRGFNAILIPAFQSSFGSCLRLALGA